MPCRRDSIRRAGRVAPRDRAAHAAHWRTGASMEAGGIDRCKPRGQRRLLGRSRPALRRHWPARPTPRSLPRGRDRTRRTAGQRPALQQLLAASGARVEAHAVPGLHAAGAGAPRRAASRRGAATPRIEASRAGRAPARRRASHGTRDAPRAQATLGQSQAPWSCSQPATRSATSSRALAGCSR